MSSWLHSPGRLIVLIRRHGIELRAVRTKARKGRLALHGRFLADVAVPRKIRDIYCSHFAIRIRDSGQFNDKEFPSIRETAFVMHLRDGLVFVSRMSKFFLDIFRYLHGTSEIKSDSFVIFLIHKL